MAAIAATDVTIAVNERTIAGAPPKRIIRGTITFGDGALTYPTGGVPMPTFDKFGFVRNLDDLVITGISPGPTSAQLPMYDRTNNKLSLFQDVTPAATAAFPEVGAAFTPAARVYGFEAIGW